MTHIEQRMGDSALWAALDPILNYGEAGHEDDTGRWKLGDGTTAWNDLPYKSGVDSVAGKTGEVELDIVDVTGAAPLASPAFTGSPTAPTRAGSDDSTHLATTEWVRDRLVDTPLTGNPTAPTPATADNDTSIATTAYVKAQFADTVFTGNPTAPTPADGDADTSIATTGFVTGGAWTALANANWQPFGAGYGTPGVVRMGRMIVLRGMTKNVSVFTYAPGDPVLTLPLAFRPPATAGLLVRVSVSGVETNTRMNVFATGVMTMSTVSLAPNDYVFLDDHQWPIN